MEFAYADIIKLQRPVHTNDLFGRQHPRMTLLNRAKIFSPFAALKGFEEVVASKEVQYVPQHVLDADEEYELNRRLGILYDKCRNGKLVRANGVVVSVEYFVPCTDKNNDAFGCRGLYCIVTGLVQRIDCVQQYIIVAGTRIAFDSIYEITDPKNKLFEIPEAES